MELQKILIISFCGSNKLKTQNRVCFITLLNCVVGTNKISIPVHI